jgi:transketolase
VLETDGHDIAQVARTLSQAREGATGVPTAIVAHTVKGKGVSFMEHQFAWHARPLPGDLRAAALAELGEGETTHDNG